MHPTASPIPATVNPATLDRSTAADPVSPSPFPAPPLARPWRASSPTASGSKTTKADGLYDALAAARELTLTSVRLTRHLGRGDELELVSDLRRSTAGVALGLETRTARSLLTSLHALWCTSDLIDQAERRGLLTLEQALELLALGSRVEIPLMAFLRRCGLEIVPGPDDRERQGR